MVEGARLEIVCRVTPYRGFESHSLRHNWIRIGAVAQLGERQVRNLEVVGSIPICSTTSFPDRNIGRARRGDSGALYPQSAIAGSNSHPEVFAPLVRPEQSSVEDWILRNEELLNPVRTGR